MSKQKRTEEKLSVGNWVEVRSKDEILDSLDAKGQLDGMPFMPEMFRYCGQRFQVYKRAHKTCDYSTPYPYRTRRLRDTVHLNTRCTGEAHGGCEAGCLLYWKLAWLKSVGGASQTLVKLATKRPDDVETVPNLKGCRESAVWEHTRVGNADGGSPTYICQTTEIPHATTRLVWWDLRQYFEDYWSGNVGLRRVFSGLTYSIYYHLSQAGIGLGRPMRWLYDRFAPLWGGSLFPRTPGLIPAGKPTPSLTLNLQIGELVRVKSHEEILKTVDVENRNRGMYWDAELAPYCNKTYRVLKRVTKLIDEKTSKMVEMKSPCIVLDSVVCQARYSQCRMLCPKSTYPYWREIWLERVADTVGGEPRIDETMASARIESC